MLVNLFRQKPKKTRSTSQSSHHGKNTKPLSVEKLEDRQLLAGDLWVTDFYLTDGRGNRVETPAVGEQVFVKAEFKTRDLPTRCSLPIVGSGPCYYLLEFSMGNNSWRTDPLNWGVGQAGTQSWIARWGPRIVKPGAQTVQVKLDAIRQIGETSEFNNIRRFDIQPSHFRSVWDETKFVTPIAGEAGKHWWIENYVDLDRRADQIRDYLGGEETYDGHAALDIDVRDSDPGDGEPDFTSQDVGMPVIAAATGVVKSLRDGQSDRNSVWCKGLPDGVSRPKANVIKLDHGNGWTTEYVHLRTNSVAVSVGDVVKTGDIIGLVGSSGCSTDPHLHFEVRHNGSVVETYVNPQGYWHSWVPIPYDRNPSRYYPNRHITENGGTVLTPTRRITSVQYETLDDSAKAGQDYQNSSGTAIAAVSIPISDDNLHEAVEKFQVRFSRGLSTWSETVRIIDNDHLLNFDEDSGWLTVQADTNLIDDNITVDVVGKFIKIDVNEETCLFPINKVKALNIISDGGNENITIKAIPPVPATIITGEGSDTIQVWRTAEGSKLDIVTGSQDDTIRIGRPASILVNLTGHTLDDIRGEITVIGQAGDDQLSVYDTWDGLPGRNYTISSNKIERTLVADIRYVLVENLSLHTRAGHDTITIDRPSATTTVDTRAGNDTIIVNGTATGNTVSISTGTHNDRVDIHPRLSAPLIIAGGDQSTPSGDAVNLIGDGNSGGLYKPSATTTGNGLLGVSSQRNFATTRFIEFTGMESASATGFGRFDFITPNASDQLTIREFSPQAHWLSGSSGAVEFTPMTFSHMDTLAIDMKTADTGNVKDGLFINAGDLPADGVEKLVIDGGKGRNEISVNSGVVNLDVVTTAGARNDVVVESSATANFVATQYLTSLHIKQDGLVTLTPGGDKALVTESLLIAGGTRPRGTLDINDNGVVVDYDNNERTPLSPHLAQIARARNQNGPNRWTGPGITSTRARMHPDTVDVIASEATDEFGQSGGTFYGVDLKPGDKAVLIRTQTADQVFEPGDANHDCEFNSSDLVQVLKAAKFETKEPASFEEGDWNGDGVFDSADLILALQDGWFEKGPYC